MQSKSVIKEAEELIRRCQRTDIFVVKYDENIGVSNAGTFKKAKTIKKWLRKSAQISLSKDRVTTVKLGKIKGFRDNVKFVIFL